MHRALRCLPTAAIIACVASCGEPATAPRLHQHTDLAFASPAPPPPQVVFLPPLDAGALPDGRADAGRRVEVVICVRSDSTCSGAPLARFSVDGTGSERLLLVGGKRAADAGRATYAAEWRVPAVTAGGSRRYRITVFVDGRPRADRDILALDVIRDLLRGLPPHSADERLVVGGLPLPILFWIERAPQRLLVQLGGGVAGSPLPADSLWSYATTIPYAFTAAPGYENVLVRLDGMPATASGTIIADSAHTLSVTADRHVTVPPAAASLYDRARQVLRAADPAAAFQDYLNQAATYVDLHGADTGLRHVQDVEYLAFDPIRDSVALRRLDAALAGHELTIASDTSSGSSTGTAGPFERRSSARGVLRTLAAAVAPDSLERSMILYVNGIWTPQFGPEGAAAAYTALRILVSRVPLLRNPAAFAVHYFYNRTYGEQSPTPDQQRAHCAAVFISRLIVGYQGANAFAPFMADCMADPTYRRFSDHDLIECIRQMVAIIAGTDGAEVDAIRLAQRIQQHRANGRHIILVPHSQGNLMANEAIHHLRSVTAEYDPTRDSTCIGVISLASPTSRRWELGDHYLVPIVVRGDAVPAINNDWPAIDTDLSHALLDTPTWSDLFTPTGIILHSAIDSYMEQPQSRAAIQSGLLSVYGACAARSVSIQPASSSVTSGASVLLSATPLNAFGDTLAGRTVAWSSGNAGVATISQSTASTATLQALSPGTSIISAWSHGGRGDATFTVAPRAPSGDPYAFSYGAPYPEGFLGDDPHLSGTIAHPGAVPLPAGTLPLSFYREYGQLTAAANNIVYGVSIISPDTVILSANGVRVSKYTLVWNEARTALTGTFQTEIWRFQMGSVPVTLPLSFQRLPPGD